MSKHNAAEVENSSSLVHEKDWCMLVSVGAKQVLTSWLLRNGDTAKVSASEDQSSISSQWISTHIPAKNRGGRLRTAKNVDVLTSESDSTFSGSLTPQIRSMALAEDDNDWRYLAVSSFVVEEAETKYPVNDIFYGIFLHICIIDYY